MFTVFGRSAKNSISSDSTVTPPSSAKPVPSERLPNAVVMAAPPNTPDMFMKPYAVARWRDGTNWHRIGIVFVSKKP